MTSPPDPNLHTLFSARDLIAAVPPPPAAGLRAPALVRAAALHLREPAPEPARTRWWQVIPDLLRDGGMLVARDAPRGRRRVAFWGALVYQFLWLIALTWIAWVRFAGVPGTPTAQSGTVVEVTFIDGTSASAPASAGTAPLPLEAAPVPVPPAPAPAAAVIPPPSTATPPALAVAEPESNPAPADVPATAPLPESPLQVTEVPEPDHDFTLYAPELPPLPAPPLLRPPALPLQVAEIPLSTPPPRLPVPAIEVAPIPAPSVPDAEVAVREVPLPDVPAPALPPVQPPPAAVHAPSMPLAEVAVREIPLPQPAPQPIPPRAITLPGHVPALPTLEPELRPIPAPLPQVTLRAPAASALPLINPGAAGRTAHRVQERAIALQPEAETASARSEPGAATATAASSGTPAVQAQTPAAATPSTPQVPVAQPTARAADTPLSDDWGQTAQVGSGLLDASGRPRLASGTAAGRLPPGTVVEHYENIDRMGTWLKRAPTGYESSAFEQFWLPPEDIFEEWVRRSIKTILIPIPGTGKSIQCTVVLLMLGGGCGIRDMNLLDIEATARKPPEVPFKPELHEDQSSLAPPAPRPLPEADGQ